MYIRNFLNYIRYIIISGKCYSRFIKQISVYHSWYGNS